MYACALVLSVVVFVGCASASGSGEKPSSRDIAIFEVTEPPGPTSSLRSSNRHQSTEVKSGTQPLASEFAPSSDTSLNGTRGCLPDARLAPVTHPYYSIGEPSPKDWSEIPPAELRDRLRGFDDFVRAYFGSADDLLKLQMLELKNIGPVGLATPVVARNPDDQSKLEELLAELEVSGYCNLGVDRILSVLRFAQHFGRALAFSENGYDGLDVPDRFGSAFLYFAYHTPSDPLHELVREIELFIVKALQSSEVWKLFYLRIVGGVRYCYSETRVAGVEPVRQQLDELLGGGFGLPDWSPLAAEQIVAGGYVITEFEQQVLNCMREFDHRQVQIPYDQVEFALYLSAISRDIIRSWFALYSDEVPSNLTVVD